ncbi:MAG: stage III sporulation protein AB [Paraclostridium sp.]
MQIKIFLIGTLIASSYLIGEYIYKAYIKRHKQLSELIRILEIMRMDLAFGLYTLEEVFNSIGNKKEFELSAFFENMGSDLRKESSMTLDEILEKNSEKMRKETYLQDKEVEELKKLILTLGKSDICSQERMIDLAVENLKKLTSESQEDINKKGMVYRKLATIMGVIVGIILI